MKDDLFEEMLSLGGEWDKDLAGLSLEEVLEYVKAFYEKIESDPDAAAKLPPEMLEKLKAGCDGLERSIENARVAERNVNLADQNAVIARANFDRAADALLNISIGKKGN